MKTQKTKPLFNSDHWDSLPGIIKEQIPTVFILHSNHSDQGKHGSAVLVKKQAGICYFLTNKHVTDDTCSLQPHCPEQGICLPQKPHRCGSNARLAQNVSIKAVPNLNAPRSRHNTYSKNIYIDKQFKSSPIYALTGLNIVGYDAYNDIAMVAVKNKKFCQDDSIGVAHLTSNCPKAGAQKLYGLGYPQLKSPHRDSKQHNQFTGELVWSSGFAGKLIPYQSRGKDRVGRHSNQPISGGSSGGPSFNLLGDLVYLAVASKRSSMTQSMYVDCDSIQKFVRYTLSDKRLHNYQKHLDRGKLITGRAAHNALLHPIQPKRRSTYELRIQNIEKHNSTR